MEGRFKTLALLNSMTFIVMVVTNALANILPINGMTTGAVSDAYPNLFAPAALTFAIWGVIYTGLFMFIIYQSGIIKQSRQRLAHTLEVIGPYFWISSLANTLWIFAWHYEWMGLSLILMIVILVSLILINVRLFDTKMNTLETWTVRVPFSIYFGWITVATIANVTVFLVSINWNGFGLSDEFWTIGAIIAGVVISMTTAWRLKNIVYSLVIIWAYFGIWVKHTSANGFNSEYPAIINTVIGSIVVVCIMIGFIVINKKKTA